MAVLLGFLQRPPKDLCTQCNAVVFCTVEEGERMRNRICDCYYSTRVAKAGTEIGKGEPLPVTGTQGTGSGPSKRTQVSAGTPHLQRGKKKELLVTSGILGGMGHMLGSLHSPHVVPLSTQRSQESPSPHKYGPRDQIQIPKL